jgi:hypothetical protein
VNFTPDQPAGQPIDVPFFEDARADVAPGYRTILSEAKLREEVLTLLAQLGASDILIQSGAFEYRRRGVTGNVRYGYAIRFRVHGQPAQMQVAGLPIRSNDTPAKRDQVRRQALFIVAAQLKAMVTAIVFAPGSAPLVQYILISGTQRTVGEYVVTAGGAPNMNPQLEQGEGR